MCKTQGNLWMSICFWKSLPDITGNAVISADKHWTELQATNTFVTRSHKYQDCLIPCAFCGKIAMPSAKSKISYS